MRKSYVVLSFVLAGLFACSESKKETKETKEPEFKVSEAVVENVLNDENVWLNADSTLKKGDYVKISTDFGDIYMVVFDETPKHKENFLKLVDEKFYDGTTFHRVMDGFMIQGGDPNSKDNDKTNDGQGGPGYTIPAEITTKLRHVEGAVAAARLGDAGNPERRSSGCQFYIVENEDGTGFLDNQYTVFGQVVKGLEVVHKIADQKVEQGSNRPFEDIKMTVEKYTVE